MIDRPASLDRVIDDVARSMSDGETPALRARVVANLGRQRRLSTGFLVPAAMLASAAAIAVAAHWTPSRPLQESASRNAVAPKVVARADAPAAAVPSTQERLSTALKSSPRAADTVPAEAEVDDAPSIAALPTLEAMPVSEIQPKPLGVSQLNVEHVASVTPLAVAALDEINRDR